MNEVMVMKIAQNGFKKRIDVLEKYGLSFDVQTGKYYFAKIKKDKEEYILFLLMIIKSLFNNTKNIDTYIVNNYAYMDYDIGKIEDITLIDVMKVRAKYFKQQQ